MVSREHNSFPRVSLERLTVPGFPLALSLQIEALDHFFSLHRRMPFFGVMVGVDEVEGHALHVRGIEAGRLVASTKVKVMLLPSGESVACMRGWFPAEQ